MTPSTTLFQKGDVVLVLFPQTSGSRAATRPALVILDTGDADVLLARITTQPHGTPFDVRIGDWRGAGLLGPSVVRLHKLATLEKTQIHRLIGQLQPADRSSVGAVLQRHLGNW